MNASGWLICVPGPDVCPKHRPQCDGAFPCRPLWCCISAGIVSISQIMLCRSGPTNLMMTQRGYLFCAQVSRARLELPALLASRAPPAHRGPLGAPL